MAVPTLQGGDISAIQKKEIFLSQKAELQKKRLTATPSSLSYPSARRLSNVMRCPYPIDGVHPCRKCLPCKLNDRRLWTQRILLEAMLHVSSVFLTLTYDDEHLPETESAIGTLSPEDLRNFLKKLRKVNPYGKLRYFAAGEYGEESFRPHYHLILFNFPACEWGGTRYAQDPTRVCCSTCSLVRSTWGKGGITLGDVTPESAQYTAGYTIKKMTRDDDPRLQRGNSFLHPEFSRKSLKPGLGAGMIPQLAAIPFSMDMGSADVPSALRHGKKILPLGRYLKQKWREEIGRDKKMPKETALQIDYETLFAMRILAKNSSRPLKEIIKESTGNSELQLKKLQEIYNSKKGRGI